MGAVHDFAAVVISLRNEGKSISEITEYFIHPKVKHLFFLIVFFALLIVIAIFGIVMAVIFEMFPESVFPVWAEIPIALLLGYKIKTSPHKKTWCFAAILLMYVTVAIGHFLPISIPSSTNVPVTGIWTILLLAYAFIASILPVTKLLQPRDYINAWQLVIVLIVLVSACLIAGVTNNLLMVAPAINSNLTDAPPMLPFLMITIACGAISGFHALVGSGTTAKQIAKENHSKLIGYGSMLLEGALATIVLITVGSGIAIAYQTSDGTLLTGASAWNFHYSSWIASKGLSSKLDAFVIGSANIMTFLSIPKQFGIILMGVFVASFAGTTLDTATRIQRYILSELLHKTKFNVLSNKVPATLIAVTSALIIAFSTGSDGKGALQLWPLFGCINQLLASITLLIATLYLNKHNSAYQFITFIPFIIITSITFYATIINQLTFLDQKNFLLFTINLIIFLISNIIIFTGLKQLFFKSSKKAVA